MGSIGRHTVMEQGNEMCETMIFSGVVIGGETCFVLGLGLWLSCSRCTGAENKGPNAEKERKKNTHKHSDETAAVAAAADRHVPWGCGVGARVATTVNVHKVEQNA